MVSGVLLVCVIVIEANISSSVNVIPLTVALENRNSIMKLISY